MYVSSDTVRLNILIFLSIVCMSLP